MNEQVRAEARVGSLVLRFLLLTVALTALVWSGAAGLRAIRAEAVTKIADRILKGERFQSRTLERILATETGRNCPPAREAEALAILSYSAMVRALETSIFADTALVELEERARAALACAPHRPVLWYLLFRARTQRFGRQGEELPLLVMSYRLGRHEGWIQALRNPFVARLYDDLPPEVREIVLAEFESLVTNGLVRIAAQSFAGAPEGARDQFLTRVERLPAPVRQDFGRALRALDMPAEISGVPDPERDEWNAYLDLAERLRAIGSLPDSNR
jgi:hypothetical protein